jgi:peptidyl-prolyl cis-trans isomerase C
MWRRTLPLFVVAAVVLAYLVGRRNGKAAGSSNAIPSRIVSRPGKVLASFSGETLSVDEFKAELEAQNPFNRSRFSTPQGRREFLESLVRSELLAAEAARQGYDRDPRVLSEARKQMATRFVEEQFSEAALRKRLTDADVRGFFEAHLEDYQRPERVRTSLLFLATPAADKAARERRHGEAVQLLSEIRQAESKDPLAFASQVRRRSEDQETRTVDGDMRFLTRKEMESRWGPEIAAAAFSLGQVGRISEVVDAPGGFALLKLENIDPGQKQSFEDAATTVRARAANEARIRDLNAHVDRLKREAGVSIDDAALDAMSLDAATPPVRRSASVDLIAGTAATTVVMPVPAGAPALQGGKR